MSETGSHIVIIGGGLAGSFMAARLSMAGYAVTMIDEYEEKSASTVAAGMFNVITGRFGAKSWMADTLLASLRDFLNLPPFQSLQQYVTYQTIYRPFKEIGEYNKWTARAEDPEFFHLVRFREKPVLPEIIHNPHGGIDILPCGWIRLGEFLKSLRWILVRDMSMRLVREKLDYRQVHISEKYIQLADEKLSFDHLICCEGPKFIHNPWFADIEIIPNKGEILTIEAPDLRLPFILSRKVYLIPLGDDQYLTGSTYQNQFDNGEPSQWGRDYITEHLEKAIKVPFKIIDHRAGIRPTTPNRRPVIETHSAYGYLHVLTGFGTKGVLLAPHFSKVLLERIKSL